MILSMRTITNKPKPKRKLLRTVIIIALIVVIAAVCIPKDEYIVLNDEQLNEVLSSNTNLTPEQQTIVDSAVSLRGKIHYFWGGKSGASGWDEAWGELRTVESTGSDTSGKELPYGMDCSGYVAWCYVQLGYSLTEVENAFGIGTWYQWENSEPIAWRDVKVGDIAFMNKYPTNDGNHIGICVGFLDGKPVFAHCSSTLDTVVVSTAGDVFKYPRRTTLI